ncbi:MAG TPA: hypothetical protein DDX92_03085 [Flavobacteriales bacterium]|jgi:hypothetical protein|nr:hypothetical protein [Flavobacteriales bacterium]
MLIVFLVTNWHPALVIALAVGIAGLVSKYLAVKIEYLWMKLAWILSFIIPNILLSIVFYLILTPIAFLSRIFSMNNDLSLKDTSPSLFKDHNKTFSKDSFKNPW